MVGGTTAFVASKDLHLPEAARVPQRAIAQEPPDPVTLCLLRLQAVAQVPQALARLVEQAHRHERRLETTPRSAAFHRSVSTVHKNSMAPNQRNGKACRGVAGGMLDGHRNDKEGTFAALGSGSSSQIRRAGRKHTAINQGLTTNIGGTFDDAESSVSNENNLHITLSVKEFMGNVLAIVPPAACAAPSVSARAGSRSSRFAQLASLLWGTIPSARAGLTQALWRWLALPARFCTVVGVGSAGAQPASLRWGPIVGARKIGAPVWSRSGQARIQPPTCEHLGGKWRLGAQPWLALASAASDNRSANTDPQLQEAASPRRLRSGCLQR